MVTKILTGVVVLSILLGDCSAGLPATRQKRPSRNVPAIFAFGDSLVDSGTNNFIVGSDTRANYLPYGETFFHKATGRFTNGRHFFDFIATYFGLPFMPPFLKPGATFLQGVNFGSAGSGVLSTTGGAGVINLSKQVQQFQQVATQLTTDLSSTAGRELISKSLFAFIIGSNDLSAYLRNTTLQKIVSPAEFITSVLSQLQGHIQTVHTLGARKIMLLGIPPLGCAPQTLASVNGTNGQCLESPNTLALAYNAALKQVSQGLNAQLPNLQTVVGDPFDTVMNLILNGTSEGFTEGSMACCGLGPFNGAKRCGPTNTTNLCTNVKNYVFWDVQHPTERVHRKVAKLLLTGDASIIQPMNLKSLAEL